MNVIDRFTKSAIVVAAWILFHEFFESVLVQLFIFHMEIFVLFHISFVFEGELAASTVAMKVSSFLVSEWAVLGRAIFTTTKPIMKYKIMNL